MLSRQLTGLMGCFIYPQLDTCTECILITVLQVSQAIGLSMLWPVFDPEFGMPLLSGKIIILLLRYDLCSMVFLDVWTNLLLISVLQDISPTQHFSSFLLVIYLHTGFSRARFFLGLLIFVASVPSIMPCTSYVLFS